jgi:hypothetical protein
MAATVMACVTFMVGSFLDHSLYELSSSRLSNAGRLLYATTENHSPNVAAVLKADTFIQGKWYALDSRPTGRRHLGRSNALFEQTAHDEWGVSV